MRGKNWQLAFIVLMVLMLICPLFFLFPAGQAYGAPYTLDLQLDDPAIIRWEYFDIMPGYSGIEPVNLHNTGDIPGYIYIWISDIVDGEGLNPESETGNTSEPGELGSCILLNIINPEMSFGRLTGTGYMEPFSLPVSISSFPGSSNQALFILDTAIYPGETLELQWQWELPASVGNQAQGDTVSFTIYYMLSTFYTEEEEPGPAEPPPYSPPPTTPPSVPATTPTVRPPAEPTTPPEVPEPDEGDIIDETDIRYVVLDEPETTTPAAPDTEESSDLRGILAQASLGVAVTGTVTMTALAVIQRIRRYKLMRIKK
jgi:hypothetical protein